LALLQIPLERIARIVDTFSSLFRCILLLLRDPRLKIMQLSAMPGLELLHDQLS
jgi:hypothetical protein